MLTDKSIMPFGKYKGAMMEDVPASYLDWLDGEGVNGPVKDYIDKNRREINQELVDDEHPYSSDAIGQY